ncbi:MAG: hypothetical protein WC214_00065 [Candidatus Omnitrophota bacterium]
MRTVLPKEKNDYNRLKDTFFVNSGEQQKTKPQTKKRKKFIPAVILFFILIFVVSKYQLVLLPRKAFKLYRSNISLTAKENLSTINTINLSKDKNANKIPFYLPLRQDKEIGAVFNFSHPVNLASNKLFLCIKNIDKAPLNIALIVKDQNFFSNSLKPIKIGIPANSKEQYQEIPISLDKTDLGRTNPYRITQLKLLFSYDKNTIIPSKFKKNTEEPVIVIKDLILVKEEWK